MIESQHDNSILIYNCHIEEAQVGINAYDLSNRVWRTNNWKFERPVKII